MNTRQDDQESLLRMENILASLLRYGALFASGWIALGMGLSVFQAGSAWISLSDRCLAIGIILLIALPVFRVALMMGIFLLQKDYRFVAISGTVLVIIALGFFLGTMNPHIDFL